MAIAFDNADETTVDGTDTMTISDFTVSGDDRYLVVGHQDEGGSISGVTYNADPLTIVDEERTNAFRSVSIWYLGNPDSGTHDVVFSFGEAQDYSGGVVSLTGAKNQAPEADNWDNSGTVTVATVTDNAWVLDSMCEGGSGTDRTTVTSGQVERYESINAGSHRGYGSTLPTTSNGNYTMEWTGGTTIIAIAIEEAVAVSAFPQPALLQPSGGVWGF